MQSNICLLFDTVNLDDFATALLENYRIAGRGLCEVFAVVHSRKEARPSNYSEKIIYLNDDQIFKEIDHRKDVSRGIIPGNVDLKMLRAARELPQFERYIWVEYDVHCTGDLRSAIARLTELTEQVDFAASYISGRRDDGWMWWSSLITPAEFPHQASDVVTRAFLPLAVYTRRFVDFYEQQLKLGWAGHQEVVVGTVASHFGFRVLDLSSLEPAITHFPQFAVGEVRGLEEYVPLFVHPIKDFVAKQKVEEQIAMLRAKESR